MTGIAEIKKAESQIEKYNEIISLLKDEQAVVSELIDIKRKEIDSCTSESDADYWETKLDLIEYKKRLLNIQIEISSKTEYNQKFIAKLEQDKSNFNTWLEQAQTKFQPLVIECEKIIEVQSTDNNDSRFEKTKAYIKQIKDNNFGFADTDSMVRAYKTLLNLRNDIA